MSIHRKVEVGGEVGSDTERDGVGVGRVLSLEKGTY